MHSVPAFWLGGKTRLNPYLIHVFLKNIRQRVAVAQLDSEVRLRPTVWRNAATDRPVSATLAG
jgi:hypothetical protein